MQGGVVVGFEPELCGNGVHEGFARCPKVIMAIQLAFADADDDNAVAQARRAAPQFRILSPTPFIAFGLFGDQGTHRRTRGASGGFFPIPGVNFDPAFLDEGELEGIVFSAFIHSNPFRRLSSS